MTKDQAIALVKPGAVFHSEGLRHEVVSLDEQEPRTFTKVRCCISGYESWGLTEFVGLAIADDAGEAK